MEPPFELLLVFGVILLLPTGVYLAAERGAAAFSRDKLLEIRQTGSGKPGTETRQQWIRAQIQRARTVRLVVLAVLFSALALFIAGHVRGCVTGWGQDRSCRPLEWRTHDERLKGGNGYKTRQGETLAQAALANGISLEDLARTNGAVALKVPKLLESALNPNLKLEPVRSITLEAAAQKLGLKPEEVARGFSMATLAPGQDLRIPVRSSADPLQWYDWFLWTLIGLAASLLVDIGRHFRKIFDGEGDFLGETTWYWAQLVNGPLVAFVILLLFTHIDLDLLTGEETATVEVNLHRYPIDLLIVPAFLLGFYSRVARKVLDQIMQGVFNAAWRATYGDFEVMIRDHTGDDEIDSKVVFETQPPLIVAWSATDGEISPSGVFQPPRVDRPKQVFVTAVPAGGASRAVTKTITVVRHKFKIVSPDNQNLEIRPGQPFRLTIDPLPPSTETGTIVWDLVGPIPPAEIQFEPKSGPETKITIPSGVTSPIKVKATFAGLTRDTQLNPTAAETGGAGSTGASGATGNSGSAVITSINAKIGDKVLAEGETVPSGTELSFEALGFTEEQAQQIGWEAQPAGSITLSTSKGPAAVGKVEAKQEIQITVTAQHPAAGKASFGFKAVPG